MKKLLFCISFALGLSVIGAAQTVNKRPKTKDEPETSASARSSDGMMGSHAILSAGTSIEGELQSSLDVKKARVGDEVRLRTTKAIKQNGQTLVPKGSKLIGRVTEVQEKTNSNRMSKLGMVFDRLEIKNMSAPFSASITSITNIATSTRAGNEESADLFSSNSTSTQTSDRTSSGGGLLGGVRNTVGGAAVGVLNTTTQSVGGVSNTAGRSINSSVGTLGGAVNGIQISNSVGGSAELGSTLSTGGRNIRLDKGATLQLVTVTSVKQQ